MYRITCDNHEIFNTNNPFLKLVSAVLELELNSSGTLNFEIDPTHYFYNNIKKRKSVIKVLQNDEIIFFGSAIDEEVADNLIKTVTVEGALAWLNDTVQPYVEYNNISVEDYLQALINNHNARVSEFKQFILGSVTVTDSNDSLYRFTNFEKTKDCIADDLIDNLGGYIKARHVNGVNYIDYVASSGGINTQGVRFGFNLIECAKELKSSTTATAIIPLGAKLSDDTDERLTIADVNDGVIYVYDEDSVEEFDWIYDTVVFDDVTVASNLKAKGIEELTKRKYLSGSYSINSIDMGLLDGNYDSVRLGDTIPIISVKHDIDDFMAVSAMNIDICDPAQSVITIGSEFSTLTDSKNYSDKIINKIVTNYVTNEQVVDVRSTIGIIEENISEIIQTSTGIQLSVENLRTTTDELDEEYQLQRSLIEQNAEEIALSFIEITNNNNDFIDSQTTFSKYINFSADGVKISDENSNLSSLFSNIKLSFLQNGVEIAYISNNELCITNARILKRLTMGEIHQWDWIVKDNGNLTLKYRTVGGETNG